MIEEFIIYIVGWFPGRVAPDENLLVRVVKHI